MIFDIDEKPLTFGKYKGKTPNEIFEINPSYLVWAYEEIEPKICSYELALSAEHEDSGEGDGFYDWNSGGFYK